MTCTSEEARQQAGNQKELCLHSHKLYFITSNFTEEKLWLRGRIITRILDSLNIGSISASLMYLLL